MSAANEIERLLEEKDDRIAALASQLTAAQKRIEELEQEIFKAEERQIATERVLRNVEKREQRIVEAGDVLAGEVDLLNAFTEPNEQEAWTDTLEALAAYREAVGGESEPQPRYPEGDISNEAFGV